MVPMSVRIMSSWQLNFMLMLDAPCLPLFCAYHIKLLAIACRTHASLSGSQAE